MVGCPRKMEKRMSRLRPTYGPLCCLTALAGLIVGACGSTDVPIGQADPARAGDGGASSTVRTPMAGAAAAIDTAGSTMASGTAAGNANAQGGMGANVAGAGSNVAGAGGGATLAGAAGSGDAGAAPTTCSAAFSDALVKDCTSAADCVLANHDDCCGNVVTAIKKGTTASFDAADQSFQACTPGCGVRGCFHADTAEDGKQLGSVGDAFAAVCQSSRCTSTVVPGASECNVDADCSPGLVCVAFVTNAGATTTTTRACHANPCNNITASCGCGSGICTSAGFPLCSVNGTQLVCDDGRQ